MATKASIENERIGRELFQVFIDQFPNELEWTPTNNIHDYIDGIVRYHENNYSAVEIKTINKKYENYTIGVDEKACFREILYSDSDIYSGSTPTVKKPSIISEEKPYKQHKFSFKDEFAPFSAKIYEIEDN